MTAKLDFWSIFFLELKRSKSWEFVKKGFPPMNGPGQGWRLQKTSFCKLTCVYCHSIPSCFP